MKLRDGAALWESIQKAKLDKKAIGDLSLDQVELLADILDEFVAGSKAPYFKNGELVIPFGAPLECRWWSREMTQKQKVEMLNRCGVPQDKLHVYLEQRDIDVAMGRCDASGRTPKHKESKK